jgi:hypothetical protein
MRAFVGRRVREPADVDNIVQTPIAFTKLAAINPSPARGF